MPYISVNPWFGAVCNNLPGNSADREPEVPAFGFRTFPTREGVDQSEVWRRIVVNHDKGLRVLMNAVLREGSHCRSIGPFGSAP